MYSLGSKLVNNKVQEVSWPLVRSIGSICTFFPAYKLHDFDTYIF